MLDLDDPEVEDLDEDVDEDFDDDLDERDDFELPLFVEWLEDVHAADLLELVDLFEALEDGNDAAEARLLRLFDLSFTDDLLFLMDTFDLLVFFCSCEALRFVFEALVFLQRLAL